MKRSATGLAGLVILTLVAIPAIAQRGGDRGGRGGDGGGDFRVRILERMDANGNGTIEPNEAQGRAQGFVERMARDTGLEPGRPLPISQLTGSGARSRDDSQSQRNGSNNRTNSEQDEYPTVLIFGDDTVQTFGLSPLTSIRRQFQQRNEGGDRNARRNDEEANKVKEAYRVSGSEQLKGRKSYRSNGPALPPKLPNWWNDRDNDSDGQVSLAEFAKSTDTRVMSDFQNSTSTVTVLSRPKKPYSMRNDGGRIARD